MRPFIFTRCTGCDTSMITDQSTPLCVMCERLKAPAPPPMRTPFPASIFSPVGLMLVVLVFLTGVAVGAKMAGGW